MHDIATIFGELALLSLFGVAASLALRRAKLPPVAGLLTVGAIAGPHGLSLVGAEGRIDLLAEVGVVLLLFTIGLEFSLAKLRSIAKLVLLGGTLQVGLTIGAVVGITQAFELDTPRALLLGFVFSLSSTALVLRALDERQEMDAPHGRFIVGVLIFQDLIVVAMLLVIPTLAGQGEGAAASIGIAFAKAAAVIVGALLAARFVLPRALVWVEASRSREVFGLALLAVCLGTAWITAHLGLSLALGAFLAGMILADSEYAHRALDDVIPVRDVLTSLFFVSMGMLFNYRIVFEEPLFVASLLFGFLFAKGLVASLAAMVMRFPARVAWLAGAALAQFGEFGFVLAKEGQRVGLVTPSDLEPVFAAGLLSMFVTPVVISTAPRFAAGEVLLRPLERVLRAQGIDDAPQAHRGLRDHVVVVGYGPGGQMLVKELRQLDMPYVVLELNAQTVRSFGKDGVPIYYGDITSAEARHHANIQSAAAIVLQISDTAAAARAVSAIRADSRTPIYVRARRLVDARELEALGANCVVCEEESASLLLTREVLTALDVPSRHTEIDSAVGAGIEPAERLS